MRRLLSRERAASVPGARLESSPPDADAMHGRMDDALLKDMLGEPLSERELMIVQWVRHGGGCAACGPSVAPGHR